jgi:hypothetical protein
MSALPFLNVVDDALKPSTSLHVSNIKVSGAQTAGKVQVAGNLTVNGNVRAAKKVTLDGITGPAIKALTDLNASSQQHLQNVENKLRDYESSDMKKQIEEDPIPLQLCCLYKHVDFHGENMCFLPGDYSGPNHLHHFHVGDRPHSIKCAPGVKATLYQNHNKDGGKLVCEANSSIRNLREHNNMHPSSMVVELIDKKRLPTSGGEAKVPLREYSCPPGWKVGCSKGHGKPRIGDPKDDACKFGDLVYCHK